MAHLISAIRKPSPPQNLTEGATTLRKGQVDVMMHWKPPHYSDLPVWKYTVSIFSCQHAKNPDYQKNCNYPKISTMWFYHRVMCPYDNDGMANNVQPGSTLFAQTCLSENIRSL